MRPTVWCIRLLCTVVYGLLWRMSMLMLQPVPLPRVASTLTITHEHSTKLTHCRHYKEGEGTISNSKQDDGEKRRSILTTIRHSLFGRSGGNAGKCTEHLYAALYSLYLLCAILTVTSTNIQRHTRAHIPNSPSLTLSLLFFFFFFSSPAQLDHSLMWGGQPTLRNGNEGRT